MKLITLALVMTSVLIGCASTGQFLESTETRVSLSQKNYRMIKAGAQGSSYGFWLLGVIPIVSPTVAAAKTEMYHNVGNKMEQKATALSNVTEDRSFHYFILFSITRLTITADVIEFVENGRGDPQQGSSPAP